MLRVALEREVEDFLGRAHYERGSRRQNRWRNGNDRGNVKTAAALLEVVLAQLRVVEEPFHTQLVDSFSGIPNLRPPVVSA